MMTWVINFLFVLAGASIGVMFSSMMTISRIEEERTIAFKRGYEQGVIRGKEEEKGKNKKSLLEKESS